MIKVNSKEIKDLEKIGSGKFGIVYKKNDYLAYKIYHKTVTSCDRIIDNPALTVPLVHYKMLISRTKKLKFSHPIYDMIYIDGEFGGVCIPYYEGETLNKKMDMPLKLKLELARKMIRNSKELNNHLIFPTDYKLNNMVFTNNNIKLIDLDDTRTHASILPNVLFRSFSVNALAETIETFLEENKHFSVPLNIARKLEREKAFNTLRYTRIEEYIKNKEFEKTIIFSNDINELKKLKETILNNDFRIVYVVNKNLDEIKYLEIINTLNECGLSLFDFVNRDKIDNYFNLENINEAFITSSYELKRIYKK